jgi:hypothetical protein
MTTMLFGTTGKSSVEWILRNLTATSLWAVTWRPAVLNTVQQQCESNVRATLLEAVEEEEEDTEPEVAPNFVEALMKVKSFVYAHSNSDGDRDNVLNLESSFFELRRKVSTKQLSIT